VHIYAFGSLCRGEITTESDIDLLAITNGFDERLSKNVFSIYSYSRIKEIWEEGNPFAWHLHVESKLIYSSTGEDIIKSLQSPNKYIKGVQDCKKFYSLYKDSLASINEYGANVFELSMIFLAIRNIATCYSLFVHERANFSRDSALLLEDKKIPISSHVYEIIERARILNVRGNGDAIENHEFIAVVKELSIICCWMDMILKEVVYHG
jgi:hypothetical protein